MSRLHGGHTDKLEIAPNLWPGAGLVRLRKLVPGQRNTFTVRTLTWRRIDPGRVAMLHRSVIVDFAAILLLFGYYCLLAGQASMTECIAGVTVVPATAAFIAARRRRGGGRLTLSAPAKAFLRPLMALTPDTVHVGRALALAIIFGPSADGGVFMRQPPLPPEPVGSKGVRILSQSLTPKSFVLGDADGAEILHCLTRGAPKGGAA